MKNLHYLTWVLLMSIILFACEKTELDQEKPEIDLSISGGFPQNCETLYFDVPFTVKVLFTDNIELGAYSIDIHNNFDHHTHTTESEVCPMDTIKTPVNPFIFIADYEIPTGTSEYETDLEFTIPSSDGTTQYDEGDYHFQLQVTDKEGWSTQVGLSVKILY